MSGTATLTKQERDFFSDPGAHRDDHLCVARVGA